MLVAPEKVSQMKSPETSTVRPRLRFTHEDSAIAKYLTKQIDAISHVKSQREIAAEIGYDKANIISMFKRGETKVPLDRVPALAKALFVDPAHLFRLALEQQYPEVHKSVKDIFGHVVTANEFALIQKLRKVTKDEDPPPPKGVEKRLEEIYSK